MNATPSARRSLPLWLWVFLSALLSALAACSDNPPPAPVINNVSETQPTPQFVGGLTGVRALAAGIQHTCTLRNDRSMVCWGSNNEGQLGTGDLATRTTPTAVLGGPGFAGP